MMVIERIKKRMVDYQQLNLLRSRIVTTAVNDNEVIVDGKKCISFCSNNYLGLANHPAVIKAAKDGLDSYGIGSTGSALISGYTVIHQQLEHALAEFLGYERVLLFTSGYMANLGVIQALANNSDTVFADKRNHASLLDAMHLAKVNLKRYPHGKLALLEDYLTSSSALSKWIVSDSVFSMEGDIAPVAELMRLAQQYQAHLVIDDSHGIGVMGNQGQGIIEQIKVAKQPLPLLSFSLGKAFGCSGGVVAGSELIIESLLQFSRSYIYTTAISPALASAALASLQLIITEDWRREQLNTLIAFFIAAAGARNLPLIASNTPIQSLLIGDENQALLASEQLFNKGFFVRAIRTPTVPRGTARLRITLNCLHSELAITQLLDAVAAILQ